MKLSRPSLILFVLAAGCAGKNAPKRTGEVVILAVGESTTAQAQGWPSLLEKDLQRACPGTPIRVPAFAASGADSSDIAARMGAGLSIYRPQAVIAMVGANDNASTAKVTEKDIALFGQSASSFEELQNKIFQEILHRDPLNDRRYIPRFAQPYRDARHFDLAKERDLAVLAAHSKHVFAALDLASMELANGNSAAARAWNEKALAWEEELQPIRLERKFQVFNSLISDGADHTGGVMMRLAEMEKKFPRSSQIDFAAALYFLRKGMIREARLTYEKIYRYGSEEDRRLASLRILSVKGAKGRLPLPAPFVPGAVTLENLRSIASQVKERGAAFFYQQYPLRDPSSIATALGGLADGVISNNEGFREATDPDRYPQFFTDRFAGDFGHFQPRAAALVAAHASTTLVPWLQGRGLCK